MQPAVQEHSERLATEVRVLLELGKPSSAKTDEFLHIV